MKSAIYPGSFDPCTYGHLNIIQRAAQLTDKLVVAVMRNSDKAPLFSVEERVELLQHAIDDMNLSENIEVVSGDGLLAEFARGLDICVIIKGIRDAGDLQYEQQMALVNQAINPELTTVLLPADIKWVHFSSRLFKEVAHYGGNVAHFAPNYVVQAVEHKMK